jgi:hypothetical protein
MDDDRQQTFEFGDESQEQEGPQPRGACVCGGFGRFKFRPTANRKRQPQWQIECLRCGFIAPSANTQVEAIEAFEGLYWSGREVGPPPFDAAILGEMDLRDDLGDGD